MPELLFEDEFLGNNLDSNKWTQIGGLRGSRGFLNKLFRQRFGSGSIEVNDSIATFYGGGKRRDFGIRTRQTFNPYDGDVYAEVKAQIQRPNYELDDVWISFRVTEDEVDKYVPFSGLSAREKESPPILLQLLFRKQTKYYPDFQLRTNDVLAKSLTEERLGLIKTKHSNSFPIAENEWHTIKLYMSKNSQSVYLDDRIAAKTDFPTAKTSYRFMAYTQNTGVLKLNSVNIYRE